MKIHQLGTSKHFTAEAHCAGGQPVNWHLYIWPKHGKRGDYPVKQHCNVRSLAVAKEITPIYLQAAEAKKALWKRHEKGVWRAEKDGHRLSLTHYSSGWSVLVASKKYNHSMACITNVQTLARAKSRALLLLDILTCKLAGVE